MNANDLSVVGNRPFFIPGGTLPGDAPSYVTRQADHNLLEGLRGGLFCYVLTSRQMGKSSLMVRTASRLREAGVTVAVLDLTALGQNLSVEQWYYGLLEQLGRHLGLEDELDDYWQSHKALGPMQRWMAAIRDVALCRRTDQIVVFVDEIDIVRSLPFSTDEFFAAIRECYNRRAQEPSYERLTFCLLGVATPSDLIRDTTMTPFNIGHRIELTDFTLHEAAPLSVGISVTERDGQALLNRVLYWTGGHPYLTQRLCALIAEDTAALREEDVDRLCADLFLTHKARESDDNLQFVRSRLLQSEVDLTALLDLYARVRQGARVADDETNALTSVLKLSGVVRVERGELKVRNRIYVYVFDPAWIRVHMPDAELRRQRAAAMKARWQVGSIAAVILLFMGGLTVWAVRNSFLASRAQKAERQAKLAYAGQLLEAQRQAQLAVSAKNEAIAQATRAKESEQQANRYRIRAEKAAAAERTLSAMAAKQRKEAERATYCANMKLISDAYDAKHYDRIGELLKETKQEKYRLFRGFEWGYWNRLQRLNLLSKEERSNNLKTTANSFQSERTVMKSGNKAAKIWEVPNDRRTLVLHEAESAVAFSPNGTWMVTKGADDEVKVWDLRTGHESGRLKVPKYRRVIAISTDGTRIATHELREEGKRMLWKNDVKVWDTQTGKKVLTLKGICAEFSPDGRWIVTGQMGKPLPATVDDNSMDGCASVWDAQTGREIIRMATHRKVSEVAFSPDGTRILTVVAIEPKGVMGTYHRRKVWSMRTGKEIFTLPEPDIWGGYDVAYSRDGAQIVKTNGIDSTVTVCNAKTGKEIITFHAIKWPTSIAFSPDGQRIVIGGSISSGEGHGGVWDAQTGREILRLPIDGAYSAVFSPDGKRIITSGIYTAQFMAQGFTTGVQVWFSDPID